MAVTKIHAIKSTLSKALNYIENPEKTEGQLYVSGYNVDPLTASIEYEMTASLARELKGNYTRTGGGNNLAYHMMQSFSPNDNVTPEQAHEIGKKLADELLDGKYEYVISTHIDKGHIHNHIIFNAVSFYDYKKFNSQPYKTASKIRAISDRLCSENELSVLKEKGNLGYSYKEYKERKKDTSWKAEIRKKLNYILDTASSYEEFTTKAAALGVTVDGSGKHIKFKLEGQERYSRGNKLADNGKYEKDGIIEQLTANKRNQEFVKNAIKEVSKVSENYENFVELMKEQSIIVHKERSGNIVYKLDDMDNSKVLERALGIAYNTNSITNAIKNKSFDFIEPVTDSNIKDEYDKTVKTKVEDIDTRILLSESNISKITVDGILIELPDETGMTGRVFINNSQINYIEESKEYEIYIGDKYDYYFVKEELNPDILEGEQLSSKFVKGESVIRTLEKQNEVKPVVIEIGASDLKEMSPKGIVLSLPDMNIDSLFIENEYVIFDKLSGSCKVQIYENWNYNYRTKGTDNKNILNNIKGQSIIKSLNGREMTGDLSSRIAALERRNLVTDTKELANALLLIRKESISHENDFDIKIKELQEKVREIKDTIKTIDNKNENYKDAVKCLLTFNKYLPIKQELEKQSFVTKKSYAKRHESELLAFDYASSQLEKLGVNTNVVPDKVINLIKEQDGKIKEMTKNFKDTESRINELKAAQAVVQNLIKPQERKQLETEKKQEQGER